MKAFEKYVLRHTDDGSDPRRKLWILQKKRRVIVVIFLTVGYYYYNLSMMYRKLSYMNNPAYDEAEMKRRMFGDILEGILSPEENLSNKDYLVNQSIANYDYMMFFNKSIGMLGYNQENIIEFYKSLDYSCPEELVRFKAECDTHYQIYSRMLLAYINEDISYKELENKFVRIELPSGIVHPINRTDTLHFIKDMIYIYQLFQDVANGRSKP